MFKTQPHSPPCPPPASPLSVNVHSLPRCSSRHLGVSLDRSLSPPIPYLVWPQFSWLRLHIALCPMSLLHGPLSGHSWTSVVSFQLVYLFPLLSTLAHPPQSKHCSLYILRHIASVLRLPPSHQSPWPLAQNSNPAVLHKILWEVPFIRRNSLPQHWPNFCPLNTPIWFPSQGFCSCFLGLRTFLPQIFRIHRGSTPVTTSERPCLDHPS